MERFSLLDVSIFLIYFLVIYVFVYFYSISRIDDRVNQRLFRQSYLYRGLFAVLFCALYTFYYRWGDTIVFYDFSNEVIRQTLKNPKTFIDVVFLDNFENIRLGTVKDMHIGQDNFRPVIRIASLFNLLSFGSFITISFFFALCANLGMWRLYISINKLLGVAHNKITSFVLLFFPSFVIWTSGILKDPIVAMSVGLYISGMIYIFELKENKLKNLLIIVIASILMLNIKSYVAYSLWMASSIYLLALQLNKIKQPVFRAGVYVMSFAAIGILALMARGFIADVINELIYNEFVLPALSQSNKLNILASRRDSSSYDLGINLMTANLDFQTFARLIPMGIVTTLYRPFLWEASKPIIAISALENLFTVLVTLYLVFKTGFFTFFRTLFARPLYVYLLVFILIFAFGVGISSGNFGSLSRYRTPCIAIYFILIYLVYYTAKKSANEKRFHR